MQNEHLTIRTASNIISHRRARLGAVRVAHNQKDLSADDEAAHFEVTGRYQNWHTRLSWNRSDFYDLFGPTKRSRKGYAAVLGYDLLTGAGKPRLKRAAPYILALLGFVAVGPFENRFVRLLFVDVRYNVGDVLDNGRLPWGEDRGETSVVKLAWASGLLILVRKV